MNSFKAAKSLETNHKFPVKKLSNFTMQILLLVHGTHKIGINKHLGHKTIYERIGLFTFFRVVTDQLANADC